MPTIRVKVNEYLEWRKMSVREFAEKAGIAYNTALALKRGSSNRIDFDTLAKICCLFNCTPGDLIVLEGDCPPAE